MTTLLFVTVMLLNAVSVFVVWWAKREVADIKTQRDSYRLVAQLAVKELAETQELLVVMAGVKDADTTLIDRKWD